MFRPQFSLYLDLQQVSLASASSLLGAAHRIAKSFWQHRNLFVLLPLLLCISCTSLRFPGQLEDIELTLRVEAAEPQGVYAVSGETNLPNETELTVVAIRYLSLDEPAGFKPTRTYSILAYQPTEVQNGKWQTQLNLWQVAPDGDYQESWQLEQARLGLSFQPATDVIFLATLTPPDKLSRLEQLLAAHGMRLSNRTVQTTPEGQRYAQIDQTIAIALPTGATTPPQPDPNEENYGWGYRYLIPKEPQNPYDLAFPKERQTNAPADPNEFLR
ncbi:hypothetical protein IFO70_03290 [Phormidium tenue FACHB-886]|nr:hypothetical protein [Phormidium tenue FACHB-886]